MLESRHTKRMIVAEIAAANKRRQLSHCFFAFRRRFAILALENGVKADMQQALLMGDGSCFEPR